MAATRRRARAAGEPGERLPDPIGSDPVGSTRPDQLHSKKGNQMTLRGFGRACPSLSLLLLAALLASGQGQAAAQADCGADQQALLSPGTMLAGARVLGSANPFSLRANPGAGVGAIPGAGLNPSGRPNPFPARPPFPGQPQPRRPDFAGYLPWLAPSVVAARGNFVYVVDGGRRQIFLYDLSQQTMTPFGAYAAGNVAGIAVAPDMSLYVADANARKVLHFSFDGRLLRTFSNEFELSRPAAVILDERSGNVLVADSLLNHVVVFNSLGRVLAVLRSDQSRSTEAMARGPDGLYLVDRLAKQVVVIGLDGADRYLLGKGTLKNPGAIAVDRFNRVFVSDSFDNTIKIYEREQLVATVGGSGATPASFNRITSMWLEQNMLYVTDSLNARIQTFRVAAPCVKERPHD
jgi:hypothetical protein